MIDNRFTFKSRIATESSSYTCKFTGQGGYLSAFSLTFMSNPNGTCFNGGLNAAGGTGTRELIVLDDCARTCEEITSCLGFYYRTDTMLCVLLNSLDSGVPTSLPSVSYTRYLPPCAGNTIRTTWQQLVPTVKTCTVCGSGFYTKSACTTFQDATCVPYSSCSSSQYQAVPRTATSDVICASLTTCLSNPLNGQQLQYQVAAPTATSNRVCQAITYCTSSQYQSQPPTATSNRILRTDFTVPGKSIPVLCPHHNE